MTLGCSAALQWGQVIIYVGIALVFIAFFVFSSKKRKKEEQEYKERLDSYVVGVKILTIGGIIGEIVEVNEKEVVIATGLEDNVSYIRLDKRGISGPIQETQEPETEEISTSEEIVEDGKEPFTEIEGNSSKEETIEENKENE